MHYIGLIGPLFQRPIYHISHKAPTFPISQKAPKAGDVGGGEDDDDDSRSAYDGSTPEGARNNVVINYFRTSRSICSVHGMNLIGRRTYAVGGSKAKKGGKGGGAADAQKASTLSNEVKATTVVGANILKEGTDTKILTDSEYPDWLWHLLDKHPALSELRRKNIETLPYENLKRFVKVDNRASIKESNSNKAKQ